LLPGQVNFQHINNMTNGTLAVFILNRLSAPSTAADATILMFARGADNLEFNGPSNAVGYNSMFAFQSLETLTMEGTSKPQPERFLMNFGEQIISLRQLLHRNVRLQQEFVLNQAQINIIQKVHLKLPPSLGWKTQALTQAYHQLTAGNGNFSYNYTTAITWVTACFLGQRGSINYSYDVTPNSYQTSITDVMTARNIGATIIATTYSAGAGFANSNSVITQALQYATGRAGCAVTDVRVQPMNSITAPNYTNYLFQPTSADSGFGIFEPNWPSGYTNDGITTSFVNSSVDGLARTGTFITTYVSAGTDYSVHFFLCTPAVYVYPSLPNAV
jgi:hypothetical protein